MIGRPSSRLYAQLTCVQNGHAHLILVRGHAQDQTWFQDQIRTCGLPVPIVWIIGPPLRTFDIGQTGHTILGANTGESKSEPPLRALP